MYYMHLFFLIVSMYFCNWGAASPSLNNVPVISHGYAETKKPGSNVRNTHTALMLSPTVTWFGMYNGHEGPFAVEMTSEGGYGLNEYVPSLHGQFLVQRTRGLGVRSSLKRSFIHFDKTFRRFGKGGSGTSAAVAVVHKQDLYLAHAGVNRCMILDRKGSIIHLSEPHTLDNPRERSRFERCETSTEWIEKNDGRTRSLGDKFVKEWAALSAKKSVIIARPTIKKINIDVNKPDCLILGCPLMWKSLSPDGVAQYVHDRLSQGMSPKAIAYTLSARVFQASQGQQASAMVIKFE